MSKINDFYFILFITVSTAFAILTVSFLGGLFVGSQELFNTMLITNDAVEIVCGFISIPFIFMYGYILFKFCEKIGFKELNIK
jgi:hypothetical protein